MGICIQADTLHYYTGVCVAFLFGIFHRFILPQVAISNFDVYDDEVALLCMNQNIEV